MRPELCNHYGHLFHQIIPHVSDKNYNNLVEISCFIRIWPHPYLA